MKLSLLACASVVCLGVARAGDESLLPLRTWTANIWVVGLASADFDGNGRQEVVSLYSPSEAPGGIEVFRLGPHGEILQHTDLPNVATGDAASADFDGDGFEDIAFAYTSSVAVYRGGPSGVPVLWKTVPIAGGTMFGAAAAADFDGDTWPDILVSDPNAASNKPLRLLHNDAGTGFTVLTANNATGWNVEELDVADLDADGHLDVISSERGLDLVRIALAEDTGTWFSSIGTHSVIDAPRDVHVLDLTGDGLLDVAIAVTGAFPGVSWLRGLGGGSFAAATTTPAADSWGILDTGDTDGDGDADLVLGSTGHYTWGFANTGILPQAAPTSLRTVFNSPVVLMADVNGDGWRDLLTGGASEDQLSLSFGGPQGLQLAPTWPLGSAPVTLDAADFTGDGKADVISLGGSAGHALTLADGHGDGSFGAPVTTNLGGSTPIRQVAAGYCNGDALLDLVSLTTNGTSGGILQVLISNGAAKTFTQGGVAGESVGPAAGPVVADLDGDGSVEVCLPLASGIVRVWHVNPVNNGFFAGTSYPVPEAAIAFLSWDRSVAGDLDEDGFLDVVFPGSQLKKVFVMPGGANGALGAATILEAGPVSSATCVYAVDADEDGLNDVLATDGTGVISFWRGQPGMGFDAPQTSPGSTRSSRCGDMDGDGHLDIVGVTKTSVDYHVSPIAVQRGLGNGQFQPAQSFAATAMRLALADFSSDGVPDVAVSGQNGSSGGYPQDAERVGLYVSRPYTQFTDLGHALGGSHGDPEFLAWGWLKPGQVGQLSVARAAPLAPAALFLGLSQALLPFKSGVLVPSVDVVLMGLVTDGQGRIQLAMPWPAGVPADVQFFMQWWFADTTGPSNATASNALSATTP